MAKRQRVLALTSCSLTPPVLGVRLSDIEFISKAQVLHRQRHTKHVSLTLDTEVHETLDNLTSCCKLPPLSQGLSCYSRKTFPAQLCPLGDLLLYFRSEALRLLAQLVVDLARKGSTIGEAMSIRTVTDHSD